ncbi:MAG: phytanoyl-CoA dioxygenase family protein [Actinomycetota bacterium]|nr:phytanoyl-CoA dioxygenase family protein [Actinomycetota bacterium]
MATVDLPAYRSEGYQELGSLLSQHDLDQVTNRFNELDAADQVSPDYQADYDGDGPDRRLRKLRRLVWNDPALFGPILNRAKVPDIAEQVVGPGAVAVFHAAFLKPALIGTHVALHQDQALWSYQYPSAFSVWFALTEVSPANGGLFGCPGSHAGGLIEHRDRPDHPWHASLSQVEDDLGEPKQFVLEPGQALMWDRYFAHGSAPNTSREDRRGMVMVFADGSGPDFQARDAMSLAELRSLAEG